MAQSQSHENRSVKANTEELFIRAAKQEEKGKFRSAFLLYLAAAKSGDTSCQVNVGNFYDDGTGVRRNRKAALYWYKRAYRRGDACAANNIGVMWRNEKKLKRAVQWFKKSVRLGNEEANLEIAKYYLGHEHNQVKAIRHLEKVLRSNTVSEAGMEEAMALLKQTKTQAKLR
jgi:TPR repeat protein